MLEAQKAQYRVNEDVTANLVKNIFILMFTGILITMFVIVGVYNTPALFQMISNGYLAIVILQFGVVLGLSFMINKISAETAKILFFVYSALTGLTFSVFLVFFDFKSVIFTLGITVVIFGVMAGYGYYTNEDLSKFKPILRSGLIVLIVISLINLFLQNGVVYWMMSYFGAFLFTALIGYDVNRIKNMAINSSYGDPEMIKKYTVFGALHLYLDFINLFIYLLRIFGKRD